MLTYYAITNAAALTLTGEQRRWSPVIGVVGLVGCVALITSLPASAILIGTATLAPGSAFGRSLHIEPRDHRRRRDVGSCVFNRAVRS